MTADWDPFGTISNAQQRLARDRLITADAVRTAHQHGIKVIEVDGSRNAAAVADIVAGHFPPYLPIPS